MKNTTKNLNLKLDKSEHSTKASQGELRNNSHCSQSNFQPTQQEFVDPYPSNASAITPQYLDKSDSASNKPLEQKNNCSNCNQYGTYLCDYKYQGKTYSVNIRASSIEDAQERLAAIINNGKIVGELKLSIPIPIKENWFKKIQKWLGSL